MPLYEYFCPDCNTKFDALRPMSKADDDIACKNCESGRPTRVLSLFANFNRSDTAKKVIVGGGHGGCCGGGACGCSH